MIGVHYFKETLTHDETAYLNSTYFPRVVWCIVHSKEDPSGNLFKTPYQCVLSANFLNEKIFILLWVCSESEIEPRNTEWFLLNFFLVVVLLYGSDKFLLFGQMVLYYGCKKTNHFRDVIVAIRVWPLYEQASWAVCQQIFKEWRLESLFYWTKTVLFSFFLSFKRFLGIDAYKKQHTGLAL